MKTDNPNFYSTIMRTKLSTLFLALLCATTTYAQTNVSTDQELRNAIADKANIKLTVDINLSNSTLSIAEGTTVTIDLGGHTLDRRLTKRGEGGGQVITVRNGATLNLSNGTLKGGWGGNGGGIANEGGTANLTDVNITGCIGDDRGGGISNRGTLTMTGGSLTGNTSKDGVDPKSGGGLFNYKDATATLTGVTISGNECKVWGGGGICNYGTLTLDGCTITSNKAKSFGGGIWEEGTLNMQGVNTINGNKVGNRDDNVYLYTDKLITITGSLEGSTIGVGMEKAGTFPSGLATYHSGVEPSTLFFSDNKVYRIMSENSEGHLVVDYIVRSWDSLNKKVVETTKTLTRLIGYNDVPGEGDYKEVKPVNGWFQLGGYVHDSTPEYYVVRANVSNSTLNVLGKNVHLILGDNSKLSLSGGILIYNTNALKPNLYIHSQSYGSDMGGLHITSGNKEEAAGIGSDSDDEKETIFFTRTAGDLEIHGGDLYVQGGSKGAGIGGGYKQHAGNITIYGGNIKAIGGNEEKLVGGPGIGGHNGGCGHLTIYDGNIYAKCYGKSSGIGAGYMVKNDLTATGYPMERSEASQYCPNDLTDAVSIIDIFGGQVEAHGGIYGAGIGGGDQSNGVILTIYDGDVKAYGGNDAAGIGGGSNGEGGLTLIYGGTVYAKGDGNGAGIGSGCEEISAWGEKGGTLEVTGGHVEAYGGVDAAGIGGGEDGDGGKVIISGGYVYAQGNDYGAGIGGGQEGKGGDVTITGGTVIAKAGRNETGMRAIGPGEDCDDYGVLVVGDSVMVTSERKFTAPERKNACWYRTQVRVECCDHSDGFTYTVDGTTATDHHISHCPYCNHSEKELHSFVNGKCTICGVKATAYAPKLYMPVAQPDGSFDGKTYGLTHTHLVVPDSVYRLPMATLNVPRYHFIGWEATTEPTEDNYRSPYTTATADTLYRAGNKYTMTGNICFVARYRVADIKLNDDHPNGDVLAQYNDMKVSKVTLSGRVFNKNNTWQPLVLPFALSAEELAASPLAGCTLMQLDRDSSYNDTENEMVYLNFKDTTAISAGKPYIIRWTDGNPILSPVFENVTLTNKTADSRAQLLLYKSLYNPQTFTSANKMVLYFNDKGALVHPNGESPVTVGAFRAYFRLMNFQGSDPDAQLTITSNIDLPLGLDQTPFPEGDGWGKAYKIIRDGRLFIERNGIIYNIQGLLIK